MIDPKTGKQLSEADYQVVEYETLIAQIVEEEKKYAGKLRRDAEGRGVPGSARKEYVKLE